MDDLNVEVLIDNGLAEAHEDYESYYLKCKVFHHDINRQSAQIPLVGNMITGVPTTLILDYLQITEAIMLQGVVFDAVDEGSNEPTTHQLEQAVRLWWKNFQLAGINAEKLCRLTEKRVEGLIAYRGLFADLKLHRVAGKIDRAEYTLTFYVGYTEGVGSFIPPYTGLELWYEATPPQGAPPGPDAWQNDWVYEPWKRQLKFSDAVSGRVRSVTAVIANPHDSNRDNYDIRQRIKLVEPKSGKVVFLGRVDDIEDLPGGAGEGIYFKLEMRDMGGAILQDQTVAQSLEYKYFGGNNPMIRRADLIKSMIEGGLANDPDNWPVMTDIIGADFYGLLDTSGIEFFFKVLPAYGSPSALPEVDLYLMYPEFNAAGNEIRGRDYREDPKSVLQAIAELAKHEEWQSEWGGSLVLGLGFDFYTDDTGADAPGLQPVFHYFQRYSRGYNLFFLPDYHDEDVLGIGGIIQYSPASRFSQFGREFSTRVTIRTSNKEFDRSDPAALDTTTPEEDAWMARSKVEIWASEIRNSNEALILSVVERGAREARLRHAQLKIPGFPTYNFEGTRYPLRASQVVWIVLPGGGPPVEFMVLEVKYSEPPSITEIVAVEREARGGTIVSTYDLTSQMRRIKEGLNQNTWQAWKARPA